MTDKGINSREVIKEGGFTFDVTYFKPGERPTSPDNDTFVPLTPEEEATLSAVHCVHENILETLVADPESQWLYSESPIYEEFPSVRYAVMKLLQYAVITGQSFTDGSIFHLCPDAMSLMLRRDTRQRFQEELTRLMNMQIRISKAPHTVTIHPFAKLESIDDSESGDIDFMTFKCNPRFLPKNSIPVFSPPPADKYDKVAYLHNQMQAVFEAAMGKFMSNQPQ